MTSVALFPVLPLEEPVKSEAYSLDKVASSSDLHRQLTADFRASELDIESIEFVKNYNCWLKYSDKKKQIMSRVPQDPDFKLNETYLYHGTSAEKSSVCEEGFDVNLASEGCFGKGIYFSDTPKKCTKYAKHNIILVARVILGESKTYKNGQKDTMLQREPEKPGDAKGWRKYDSVKGCPRNFAEYVIYRNDMALIEYIVKYKKADDSQEASDGPQGANTELDDANSQAIPSAEDAKEQQSSDSSDSEDEYDDAKEDSYSSSSSDDDVQTQEQPDEVPKLEPSSEEDETQEPTVIEPMQSVIPSFKIKEGNLTLDEKKAEFKRITLEKDDSEVDSMLNKTDEDLERAVYLFFAYKQVREEAAKREAGEVVEDEPFEDDGSPIFPPMVPEYESEDWNKLNEDEKTAKMDKMVEEFLTFTALEEIHRQIALKYVAEAKYNLDTALLNYYKSWF